MLNWHQVTSYKADPKKDKALDLILGSKTYQDMTDKEKQVVDEYQEEISEMACGGIVLPNTKADLEQRLFEQAIRKEKD